MFQPDEHGFYATVGASPGRRIFACMVLFSLGGLVLYIAFVSPPSAGWLIFLLAFGVGALWLAELMRRATTMTVSLTETDLRDSSGAVLAKMDEISGVERGVFAFLKPSNGFTLLLNTKKPRAWAPGLWWRVGRRVGVGGVTSAGQAKLMAEHIALRLSK